MPPGRKLPAILVIFLVAGAAGAGGALAAGNATDIKPRFNIFSVEQDSEIGKQSAAEAEKQLTLINDPALDKYLNDLVALLTRKVKRPAFKYEAHAVNSKEINAFALPGGYLYVNRGLIEAAHNEAELAGVVGHEISHVVLRHGTHQASDAYLAQAGLALFGGIIAGDSRTTAGIIDVVGGFGLNAVFLKFSRTMETEADVKGSQLMAQAGYDPLEMASFFEILQKERASDPSRLEKFFSDHPAPADRQARIKKEARLIGPVTPGPGIGGFQKFQTALKAMPPAPDTAKVAAAGTATKPQGGGAATGPVSTRIDPPSSTFASFKQRKGFYTIGHPDNWKPYAAATGYGVTIVPQGGVVTDQKGRSAIICGAIVNHYDPISDADPGRTPVPEATPTLRSLRSATDDLVAGVIRSNPYLSEVPDSRQRQEVSGVKMMTAELTGHSSVTDKDEHVTIVTRKLPDGHIMYMLQIMPAGQRDKLAPTFKHMVQSLRVNDTAAHQ